MLFVYAELSSHLLTGQERERERGSKHTRNCVYRSKIENGSYLPSRTCITSMPERSIVLSLGLRICSCFLHRQSSNLQGEFFKTTIPSFLKSQVPFNFSCTLRVMNVQAYIYIYTTCCHAGKQSFSFNSLVRACFVHRLCIH